MRIDRALIGWLKVVRAHPLGVHFIVAFALLLIIDSVLTYVFHVERGMVHGIGTEFVIVLTISVAIPFILTFLPLRREINKVIHLMTTLGSARAQDVVRRLIGGELGKLVEDVKNLDNDGLRLSTEDVSDWVRARCWDTMYGSYIGTARHLPSTYMDILGNYLMSHHDYLLRRDSLFNEKRRDSVRIMFAEAEELELDKEKSKEKYDEFLEWHNDNEVKVKLLPLRKAEELASHYQTLGATDMACWDEELVLLWLYGDDPSGGPLRLRMTFVGDRLYDRCRSYLDAIMQEAECFPGSIDPHESPEPPSKPI